MFYILLERSALVDNGYNAVLYTYDTLGRLNVLQVATGTRLRNAVTALEAGDPRARGAVYRRKIY